MFSTWVCMPAAIAIGLCLLSCLFDRYHDVYLCGFARRSRGRWVNFSARFLFFAVSDTVYHLVDFTFAARLLFDKPRSSHTLPGIRQQTVRHRRRRRQSY